MSYKNAVTMVYLKKPINWNIFLEIKFNHKIEKIHRFYTNFRLKTELISYYIMLMHIILMQF